MKIRSLFAAAAAAFVLMASATQLLAQQAGSGVPSIGAGALPRDLSPWNMFMTADGIVKAVIVILACASVVTWTVALAKAIELFAMRRRVRVGLAVLERSTSLVEARRAISERGPAAEFEPERNRRKARK